MGDRRIGGENLWDPAEMSREGYRCSAAELESALGIGLGGTQEEVKIYRSPTGFPDSSDLWIPRECLMGWGVRGGWNRAKWAEGG